MIIGTDKPASLAEVIRRAIANELADVHTVLPAKVVKVSTDANGNIISVDIQPLIKSAHFDEALSRQVAELPVITSVPIAWYAAGGYRITVPIKEGSTGTIWFSESSLDVWLSQGDIVDPIDDHHFNLSDAIFQPGLSDFKHPLKSAPTDRMTIGKDDGPQIHIDGNKIKIGSNVDLELGAVAMADAIKTWIGNAQTAFAGHSHATPAGATTSVVGVLPSAPGDLASGTVFAKK